MSADGNLILSRSFNTSPSNEEDFDPLAGIGIKTKVELNKHQASRISEENG